MQLLEGVGQLGEFLVDFFQRILECLGQLVNIVHRVIVYPGSEDGFEPGVVLGEVCDRLLQGFRG